MPLIKEAPSPSSCRARARDRATLRVRSRRRRSAAGLRARTIRALRGRAPVPLGRRPGGAVAQAGGAAPPSAGGGGITRSGRTRTSRAGATGSAPCSAGSVRRRGRSSRGKGSPALAATSRLMSICSTRRPPRAALAAATRVAAPSPAGRWHGIRRALADDPSRSGGRVTRGRARRDAGRALAVCDEAAARGGPGRRASPSRARDRGRSLRRALAVRTAALLAGRVATARRCRSCVVRRCRSESCVSRPPGPSRARATAALLTDDGGAGGTRCGARPRRHRRPAIQPPAAPAAGVAPGRGRCATSTCGSWSLPVYRRNSLTTTVPDFVVQRRRSADARPSWSPRLRTHFSHPERLRCSPRCWPSELFGSVAIKGVAGLLSDSLRSDVALEGLQEELLGEQ